MKTFIFILLITFASSSLFSQQGWLPQVSGTANNLNSIYFISETTGFTVGNSGTILKTTNSGINWIPQTVSSSTLYSVFFIDASTGWTVGTNGTLGTIFKSTNSGINWNSQNSGIPDTLFSVCFTTVNSGYISGAGGRILKTINGGTNWNVVISGTTNYLYCINFPASSVSSTGFISGSAGTILKTQNQGNNWTLYTAGTNSLYGIFFPDIVNGFTVGNMGTIFHTINGGVNWILQTSPAAIKLASVYFVSSNMGWAVGNNGFIINTQNSGTLWTVQPTTTTDNLNSVFFTNSLTGWAAGANGRILHTTNGGFVPVEKRSSKVPNEYRLYQNYPNPFNPVTKIKFEISEERVVSLKFYDVLGKEVATLINEELNPGMYEVKWDGSNFTSGIYFYQLITDGNVIDTKKLVLMK